MQLQLFMPLYLAHLIADFPLQTSWISSKKGTSPLAMLVHAAIHYWLTLLLLGLFSTQYLFVARTYWVLGLLILTHIAADEAKCWVTAIKPLSDRAPLFCADQLVHLWTIGTGALFLTRTNITGTLNHVAVSEIAKRNILAIGIVYVGVIFAGGYLIRYLTKFLAQDFQTGSGKRELRNAGLYIGWLERFLVLTAIVVQSPTMVGLILTGKSIARFPELKKPQFAEYFLIGTFLSVSLAMLGGLFLARLLWGTASLK